MSTPVGHSRLQPLQDTQRSSVSYISSDVKAPGPSWPESARRSELARPRVRCRSSPVARKDGHRSEEHTSELQSQSNLVCRLLLEKKKKKKDNDRQNKNTQHNEA